MSWIKSLLSFGPPLCSAVLIGIVSSVVDDQSQWKLPLLLLSLFPCFLPWRTWLVHLLRRREQSGDQRAPGLLEAILLPPEEFELRCHSADLLQEIEDRAAKLAEQERGLGLLRMRNQELLEYPSPDEPAPSQSAGRRVVHQDREVRKIIEQQAERVYEKVRANGYVVDGTVSLPMIRDEVLALIREVGRVYQPDIADPLRDVSIEQAGRAAGRVCLQFLVLLEQLPVPVETMSVAAVYRWIRRGVVAFDVYQAAAPWMKTISRGIYAGRLVTAVSPISVGAWWLATELGRRGTQRFVQGAVDRHAVAMLQQLISLIALEAATVFGPGFRQRDPAWAQATELVRLIVTLDDSEIRLRAGLRKLTALPLLSEYDRIYLYRSLATRQLRAIPDLSPEFLDAEQREGTAAMLERFVNEFCTSDDAPVLAVWRADLEDRLGVRLRIDLANHIPQKSAAEQLQDAVAFLYFFRSRVCSEADEQIRKELLLFELNRSLTPEMRIQLQRSGRTLDEWSLPDLNPDSELVEGLLRDLARAVAKMGKYTEVAETAFSDAAAWYRRTPAESFAILDEAYRDRIKELNLDREMVIGEALLVPLLLARVRRSNELPFCCYAGLRRRDQQDESVIAGLLIGLREDDCVRFVLVDTSSGHAVWAADAPLQVSRVRAILADYIEIANGTWNPDTEYTGVLQIAGSLRGGGYQRYFAPLLQHAAGGAD